LVYSAKFGSYNAKCDCTVDWLIIKPPEDLTGSHIRMKRMIGIEKHSKVVTFIAVIISSISNSV
jgi:hypothetical protein